MTFSFPPAPPDDEKELEKLLAINAKHGNQRPYRGNNGRVINMSHSSDETFTTEDPRKGGPCLLNWVYSYVLRLRGEDSAGKMTGDQVHTAVEWTMRLGLFITGRDPQKEVDILLQSLGVRADNLESSGHRLAKDARAAHSLLTQWRGRGTSPKHDPWEVVFMRLLPQMPWCIEEGAAPGFPAPKGWRTEDWLRGVKLSRSQMPVAGKVDQWLAESYPSLATAAAAILDREIPEGIPVIADTKTSSDPRRYGKASPALLEAFPQPATYAWALGEMGAIDISRGVLVQHGYAQTKGGDMSFSVLGFLSPEVIEENRNRLERVAEQMQDIVGQIIEHKTLDVVPYNDKRCFDYGGCGHKEYCRALRGSCEAPAAPFGLTAFPLSDTGAEPDSSNPPTKDPPMDLDALFSTPSAAAALASAAKEAVSAAPQVDSPEVSTGIEVAKLDPSTVYTGRDEQAAPQTQAVQAVTPAAQTSAASAGEVQALQTAILNAGQAAKAFGGLDNVADTMMQTFASSAGITVEDLKNRVRTRLERDPTLSALKKNMATEEPAPAPPTPAPAVEPAQAPAAPAPTPAPAEPEPAGPSNPMDLRGFDKEVQAVAKAILVSLNETGQPAAEPDLRDLLAQVRGEEKVSGHFFNKTMTKLESLGFQATNPKEKAWRERKWTCDTTGYDAVLMGSSVASSVSAEPPATPLADKAAAGLTPAQQAQAAKALAQVAVPVQEPKPAPVKAEAAAPAPVNHPPETVAPSPSPEYIGDFIVYFGCAPSWCKAVHIDVALAPLYARVEEDLKLPYWRSGKYNPGKVRALEGIKLSLAQMEAHEVFQTMDLYIPEDHVIGEEVVGLLLQAGYTKIVK